ncbi:ubiquitin carboxyl-terminal hydrolase 2 [Cordyceps fumosorosea ARSEF 2679]|uniref:ubiquitinyl hydrolase 1 n=1 Tax=Cordyceps fumosorosea (strain ARSEF 2679) TaxID=1081104 RepID=A0A162JAP6_CORFA|nr:ubiquitin carboxyl-terminal hydrolase 2 [Cordyceps fumosorosea ARSEF 2679]OAA66172.1 ubiquitin carboxyl-terminal hydrolase 2 [Cordyceps fumosorosea ARSEF 2679]
MASQSASSDTVPEQMDINLQIVSPSVGVNRPLQFPATPVSTTIKTLKGMIRDALPLRPTDSNQRLIYRGKALLREDETLLDVFGAEAVRTTDHHTMHLVLRDVDQPPVPTPTTAPPTAPSNSSTGSQLPRPATRLFNHLGHSLGGNPVPAAAGGPEAAQPGQPQVQPRIPSPAPLGQQLPPPAAAAFHQQHQQLTSWLNQVQREAMSRAVNQNQRGRAQAGMRGIADAARDPSSRRGSPAPTHTIYRETQGPNGRTYHMETVLRTPASAGSQAGTYSVADIQNMGVFTSLVENLGVKDIQFEELLTLDPTELLALQPVHGVIFLFKYPTDAPYATPDGPHDGKFDHAASEKMFFAAQTIQNACATQALLSVLLNQTSDGAAAATGGGDPDDGCAVDIGEKLREFREFAMVLPPEFRGEALSNSDLIREVHNSFARSSPFVDETARDPNAETEDAFHFVAYTPVDGTLYELDGLQSAPIAHGACARDEFPARVVEVLQRRVARYAASEIRFNLLAVCRDLRVRARAFGDEELLEREQRKRRDWRFENALRRHNFVAFAGEVLKGVAADRLKAGGDEAVEAWVDGGLKRKVAAEEAARARTAGDGDVDMK